MTILNYEHHLDVLNVHQALYRFGLFAATCGWTVNHLYENCGNWDPTTGFASDGTQTYLMCTTAGTFNGNNPDQVNTFQLWSEHRTGGTSGDQGTIIIRGRLNTATTEILGNSDHPIWQNDWGHTDTDVPRNYMKGTAPPNVWFFGNERFLAFHYDNDGVKNSQFQIGTPELFNKASSFTDGAFIHQQFYGTSRIEWDGSMWQSYAGLCGLNYTNGNLFYRIDGASSYYNRWRMNPAPYQVSASSSYEMVDMNSSTYGIGPNTGNVFYHSANNAGYNLPYANARLLIRPTVFVNHVSMGRWIPYGEIDAFFGYIGGLKNGGIFEHGSKQFMGFSGANRKLIGWCYRIA